MGLLGALLGCTRRGGGTGIGPPKVWVVDDGERIGSRDPLPASARGRDNGIWSPGQPVRLIALPGETVAFQVVVSAGEAPLVGVTVDLFSLRGPGQAVLSTLPAPAAAQAQVPFGLPWRSIERFVTHDLEVRRRSGGKDRGESLGWAVGAMPADAGQLGWVPDPLIPVEVAPSWADYPMTVQNGENRVVWFDVTVPMNAPPGEYQGQVQVRGSALPGTARSPAPSPDPSRHTSGASRPSPASGAPPPPASPAFGPPLIATLPIELRVGPTPLPYPAARTLVYYSPDEILHRGGGPQAVAHYLQLMHRHGLSPAYRLNTPADVEAQKDALTGALFTPRHGYDGPGEGRGADLLVLGTYGTLGAPTPDRVAQVQAVLAALAALGPVSPMQRDVILYAVDEQCASPLGPRWLAALAAAGTLLRTLRVAHTCSSDPAGQPVSLPIVHAASYDPAKVARARRLGKQVWIYNGALPQTGSFLLDGGALSLVANGWIQARYGIDRWFYWESTFWNDDNRGGQGPVDPFLQAETFHNQHGDHANGDGVLVYPGTQAAFPAHSLGFAGVVPSIRLKQWRRGIGDAGYFQLARAIDPVRAETIAATLCPLALAEARVGQKPSWPTRGAPYQHARRQLFEIIAR